MEKLRDILVAAIVLILVIKLPSCYSGDGPEKDEARAEEWAYKAEQLQEARIEEEAYKYELQKEAYDYGYSEAKRISDELHQHFNKWYDEDYLSVEYLYEILIEEYGEYKGTEIFNTIIDSPMNRVICPADLVNEFLGEPDDTNN